MSKEIFWKEGTTVVSMYFIFVWNPSTLQNGNIFIYSALFRKIKKKTLITFLHFLLYPAVRWADHTDVMSQEERAKGDSHWWYLRQTVASRWAIQPAKGKAVRLHSSRLHCRLLVKTNALGHTTHCRPSWGGLQATGSAKQGPSSNCNILVTAPLFALEMFLQVKMF